MPAHWAALRVPRARRRRAARILSPEIMISERPAEAETERPGTGRRSDHRACPPRSARSSSARPDSRCCSTCPAWTTTANRSQERSALAGHGAEAVRDAIASTMTHCRNQMRRSLDVEPGAEMSQHAQLRIDTGSAGLLLRPTKPVAAGHQREHEWSASPVLPEGHRSRAGTARAISLRWQLPSMADLERPSTGKPQLKLSTNCYSLSNKDVLRRPLETALASDIPLYHDASMLTLYHLTLTY